MKTIVLVLVVLMSGVAMANPLNPFRLTAQEEYELQTYLEYLRVERDAGKITTEEMRYRYMQRENDMKRERRQSFRQNQHRSLDCTRTPTGMRCD